ncbi:MAG: hypothetical protein ACOYBM_07710 [Dethiobacteria bacterium]|nr:hypothetical protein [Bacillota bacterium]
MKDRVKAGFIGGVVAGVAMNIIDWTGFLFGFHQERLLDWAAVVLYGYLPDTTAQVVFAQIGQLFFSGEGSYWPFYCLN